MDQQPQQPQQAQLIQQIQVQDPAEKARERLPFLIFDPASLPDSTGLSNHAYFNLPISVNDNVLQKFQALATNVRHPLPFSLVVLLGRDTAQGQNDELENNINTLADLCVQFTCEHLILNIPPAQAAAEVVLNLRHERAANLYGKICLVDAFRYVSTEPKAAQNMLAVARQCTSNPDAELNGGGVERPKARKRKTSSSDNLPKKNVFQHVFF